MLVMVSRRDLTACEPASLLPNTFGLKVHISSRTSIVDSDFAFAHRHTYCLTLHRSKSVILAFATCLKNTSEIAMAEVYEANATETNSKNVSQRWDRVLSYML
jgi:hypothetical protein